ncbi:hypothetical protein [Chitinolyticbacter meiyuanensis]|uniref:hypothetical protein n=1 Tax=Chitinolyticbacter meiyuanensis TaxID=682798 RepID=UPI0011E5B2E6|nr:hypothetical protein [Chitinolyticbacter meiyuanensis]
MATVYQKTELGQRELTERSGQVPLKARQLLIMVDGRRNFDDLASLMPGASDVIRLLQQLNLIMPISGDAASHAPVVHTPYDKLPPDARLSQVQHVVIRITREFLGESWESKLAERFATLKDGEALEALVEEWLTALRRSGHRGAADTGQREVANILRH